MAAAGDVLPRRTLVLPPDSSVDAAARAAIIHYTQALAREEPGARAGDVEAIHQMRVATRRLRAALGLFDGFFPAKAATALRDQLRAFGRGIGAVRDLDVLAQLVTRQARKLDAEAASWLGPLKDAIVQQRAVEHKKLVQLLESDQYHQLLAKLNALSPSRARRSASLGPLARELLRPLVRAVIRAGRTLDENSPAADLHRERVRVKRLRYAVEMLRGLGGKKLEKTLARLERMQELFGEHQDAVSAIAWLRSYAESEKHLTTEILATGAMLHILERRRRKLRRRLLKVLDRFEAGRLPRSMLRELGEQPVPRRPLRLVRAAAK